jgi:DNA-binding NtrC family response regulator
LIQTVINLVVRPLIGPGLIKLENNKQELKIMIINDEEDILKLYTDYLSRKGHQVIAKYTDASDIRDDVRMNSPDIFVIDYRLPGAKNGIDAAVDILTILPSAPVLFVTADQSAASLILEDPLLANSKVTMLLKPVKLDKLEQTMLELVNRK